MRGRYRGGWRQGPLRHRLASGGYPNGGTHDHRWNCHPRLPGDGGRRLLGCSVDTTKDEDHVSWSSRGQPSLGPPCAELQALPGGQSPLPGGLLLLQLSEQICRVLHDGGTKCALVVLDLFSDFINEFIHCLEMDSYGTKRFVDNFPGEAFNPNFADAVHGRCIIDNAP